MIRERTAGLAAEGVGLRRLGRQPPWGEAAPGAAHEPPATTVVAALATSRKLRAFMEERSHPPVRLRGWHACCFMPSSGVAKGGVQDLARMDARRVPPLLHQQRIPQEPAMANCECLPRCPFFNDRMANLPSLSAMMKRNFCQGEFAGCARFKVMKALGAAKVPSDLYPNMAERAAALVRAG
jgi:hypothetical protein